MYVRSRSTAGVALVEILLAVGLSMILLPALFMGMITARASKPQEQQRLQATQLLQSTKEALDSVAEKGWSNIQTNGTYYPTSTSGVFSLASGTQTVNGLTTQIVISDVVRNASGSITTGTGTTDPSTKKAVITVSWNTPLASSISSTQYFTRKLNNAVLTHTSESDFQTGTFSNTQTSSAGGGVVELKSATQSAIFTETFTTASNYTYDSNKIEVTGGVGQLKNIGTPVSGSTSNTSFDTNLTGWTFATFGTAIGQTGTRVTTGGNPSGYAQINFPRINNNAAVPGGYFRQPFTTTVANPTTTLTFQWRVSAYDPTPDNFRIYAFVDTTSAAPTIGQQVWDSGVLSATTAWSSTVSVNVSSKVTSAGTYYVKLVGYIDYPTGNKGPFTIGFDNVQINWSGFSGSAYASDSPTIYATSSLQPSGLVSWNTFSSVETLNGGSVRYQLSNDDGSTWKYHAGGASTNWQTASTSANYNTAAEVNTNMSGFPISPSKLRVKAFLIGNGTQQVKVDEWSIGYVASGSAGPNSGTYTSPTMDFTTNRGLNRLIFTSTNTANTSTQLQVAANTDNATWNYVGPDGTSGTYFTSSAPIPLSLSLGRYLRYRIFFNSTNSDLPNVTDVSVNYSQ